MTAAPGFLNPSGLRLTTLAFCVMARSIVVRLMTTSWSSSSISSSSSTAPLAHALHLGHAHAPVMPSPVRIVTVAELIAHDHSLRLYCPRCDRWAQAPLEKLAARGRADVPIQRLRFRCILCGTVARLQLRPPELPPASGTGWMQPRPLQAATNPPANSLPAGHASPTTPPTSARRRRQRRWMAPPWNNSVEH